MLRSRILLTLATLCLTGTGALAQTGGPATTQNYLSAILKGSPAQRAAEARARSAVAPREEASAGRSRGRRRMGSPMAPAE